MDRRKFLSLMSASAAGIALDQAIPFGRVWSFPSKIQIAKPRAVRPYWTFPLERGLHLAVGDEILITRVPDPYRFVPPRTIQLQTANLNRGTQ
jgi:hypothetical protein